MDKDKLESLMRMAMGEARKAAELGDYPFGAVVVDEAGNVIATARNSQNSDMDPTAHAEMNIIRQLAKTYGEEEFGRFTLVCNADSCSMCFSAAIKAGFRRFVFGAPSEGHMNPYLTVKDVEKYCREPLEMTRGVLGETCAAEISAVREKQDDLAQ